MENGSDQAGLLIIKSFRHNKRFEMTTTDILETGFKGEQEIDTLGRRIRQLRKMQERTLDSLAQEVGLDNVIAAARELGINTPLANTPSLALGTSEVSLLDLTSAYASVHLGKAPVKPWGIMDFQAAGQPKAFRVGAPATPAGRRWAWPG